MHQSLTGVNLLQQSRAIKNIQSVSPGLKDFAIAEMNLK